jgi:tRNA (cytidine/uridine-2'-O-)-methyltransferase
MFHVALFQPEIPPNTGNIIRLCANTGASLHLIEPLGFSFDDKRLRRAGLDYHECAAVQRHEDYQAFLAVIPNARIFALTTRATRNYTEARFVAGDVLLFGPETRGLPEEILESLPVEQLLRVPMQTGSRSLNLANTAALVTYEAWRQNGFAGAATLP